MEEALWVTALGMGLVFVALGLVMLSTIAVERLFREPVPNSTASAEPVAADPGEYEIVAALAAAVLELEQARTEQSLPAMPPDGVISLEALSLGWKASGRVTPRR